MSLSDFRGFSSTSERSLGVDATLCESYKIVTDDQLKTIKAHFITESKCPTLSGLFCQLTEERKSDKIL